MPTTGVTLLKSRDTDVLKMGYEWATKSNDE